MPKKRKRNATKDETNESCQAGKRITKSDKEKLICQKKLVALAHEESQMREDRFSQDERRKLIDAYNENGFQVFQDTKLLHKYFPSRNESDLKGLIQRLRTNLQSRKDIKVEKNSLVEDWQRLCQQMIGNYAKDRKVNFDEVFADVLMAEADELELELKATQDDSNSDSRPNYPALLRSFSQLLVGRFPDNMTPQNAQLSVKLFEHVNNIVDSIDLNSTFPTLLDGTWLESTILERRERHEMALRGLSELDKSTKKCPTFRDIERNRNIEALCLELPKIKRITDVLNPLHINESLVSTLMNKFNET